ncbi:MAG TPA: TetR/AcrR family transcriptional regulator [Solirubrobacteraceae bacterium]|jgi:AcrR family transcriptional regulator|nr:TetR/AcrR family transcriptional regulator [Solirubrobacteraceae bacterium]
MPRRSASAVDADRARTLREAVDLASVVGLEGLTIGSLAERLQMSKSGLAGRFGSKEQLQLAALDLAAEMFANVVYDPAASAPAGRRRLLAICDRWIAFLGEPCFRGGCFLTTASVEFDARPGPVRDAVRATMRRWLRVLEDEAATAVRQGELPAGTDPAALAFTINALAVGTNCDFQLHRDASALARGRSAMEALLAPGPAPLAAAA